MKTRKKIAVLIESDFYEKEIFYYEHRFQEAGLEVHFLSRLWGQPSLTFTGHEQRYPFECRESFEDMTDGELSSYGAVIVPSGIVSDRLRYTDTIQRLPPAAEFLKRAFADRSIIKGIICHGLWLAAPIREVLQGRSVTCHNNLYADAIAYGARYIDEDLVVDDDLVTARTGGHCHLLAGAIIGMLEKAQEIAP